MSGAEYQNLIDCLFRMERSLEEIAENTRRPEPAAAEAGGWSDADNELATQIANLRMVVEEMDEELGRRVVASNQQGVTAWDRYVLLEARLTALEQIAGYGKRAEPAEAVKLWEIGDVFNTERGFLRGEFKDLYGETCSIQESSLATQSAIWLGVNENRMHLTTEMAAELIVWLRFFVQSGALPTPAILGRDNTALAPRAGDGDREIPAGERGERGEGK